MRNPLSLLSWGLHAGLRRDIARLERLYYEPYEKTCEAKVATLRELVRHAMENVPFYREFYGKAGVVADDLRTFDDLKHLPYVCKEDFRKVPIEERTARNISRRRRRPATTSGSTGQPFSLYMDLADSPMETAAHNLFQIWSGWRPGERVAYVRQKFTKMPFDATRQWFKTRLGMSTIRVLSDELDRETVPKVMEELVAKRVTLLQGYASSLCTLARQWRDARPSSIRSVISIAETLTEDDARMLSERLGAEVFRDYSMNECMRAGFECDRHDGYHVDPLRSIVETAKGYRGQDEIVVTNLTNRVHPFIRYRAGDVGRLTFDPCPCGRRTPRIEGLGGRVLDVIELPSGKELNIHVFGKPFRSYEHAVDCWQARQVGERELEMLVEVSEAFSDAMAERIREELEAATEGTMAVRVRKVDRIPLGKNGKRDRVVSLARLRAIRGESDEGGATLAKGGGR
ncbi:phenylacetate--CoA ligase family protein [Candidatus Sumerlaeota bacterium]|nr:phenylacetate--CoA ligase family protein [Candidatus Sumerlaeota bacterium]